MENFIRTFKSNLARLIRQSSSLNLLKTLSAIEYAEAILEITSAKLFGEKFKWILIFLLQLAKCVIRLRLLIIHKIGIQPLPSLFSLENFLKSTKSITDKSSNQRSPIKKNVTFKLKSSGRKVRTIENSPNLAERDWTVPVETIDLNQQQQHQQTSSSNTISNRLGLANKSEESLDEEHYDPNLNRLRFIAEILHITRPTVHLISMLLFNSRSWKQLLVAFLMDFASLLLMNGTANLSETQRKEMKRRAIIFLFYFIRSPVYERFSSSIINISLSQFDQRIPGMRYLTKPIKDYIPYWRSIYSYCWSY